MKRLAIILLITLSFAACENEPLPETGDLLISVEYDGFAEENVEVWLFDSKYGFDNFEYFDKQFTDENGEILWLELLPGMYYIESEKTKPVDFVLTSIDSIEVVVNMQKNKRIILSN